MKKSDIYELAIKILGIYLFYSSLEVLSDAITYFTYMKIAENMPEPNLQHDQIPLIIITLFKFAFLALFAALLTLKTNYFVSIICSQSEHEEIIRLFLSQKYIYELAFAIIGFLTIIYILPAYLIKLQIYISLVQSNDPERRYDTDYLWISTLKIILGFIIIYFRKNISSYLLKESINEIEE